MLRERGFFVVGVAVGACAGATAWLAATHHVARVAEGPGECTDRGSSSSSGSSSGSSSTSSSSTITTSNLSSSSAAWRWSPSGACDRGRQTELLLEDIRRRGDQGTALEVFRSCGVVALDRVIDVATKDALLRAVSDLLAPLLASRQRVRQALRQAMANRMNLRQLWSETNLKAELLFASGDTYKERDDGRIDLTLPWADPFNRSELVLNDAVVPLLAQLLGG